jgi:TetR/AcrR family transcriptional regulator, tetracycline repressor protein
MLYGLNRILAGEVSTSVRLNKCYSTARRRRVEPLACTISYSGRMTDGLTRQVVLDTAVEIVRLRGPDALTMRALSDELGITPPTIYWHVGNKQALLDGVNELIGVEIGKVRASGATPEARIVSVARSLEESLRKNQHLASFAYERGALFGLLAPARRVFAEEFAAAGLKPRDVVDSTNAVVKLVGDHRIALNVHGLRLPQQTDSHLWDDNPAVSRDTAERLATRYDPKRTFNYTLRALVRGLLSSK